jgi:hypothetical protein
MCFSASMSCTLVRRETGKVNRNAYYKLHVDGKRLIHGWLEAGLRYRPDDEDFPHEGFIYLWIGFNAWEIDEHFGREGGEGWGCLFCAEPIERSPLRVVIHWSDDGVEREQWYAAHRACFVQHMSDDKSFEPQFSTDVGR